MGSPTDIFPTKVSVVAGQALVVLVLIARIHISKKIIKELLGKKRYVLLRQRSWKVHWTLKGYIAKS